MSVAFPVMNSGQFLGAIIIKYDTNGFIGFDVIDYTQDKQWMKMQE